LADRIIFHFQEVFKKEWEKKELAELVSNDRGPIEIKAELQTPNRFQ